MTDRFRITLAQLNPTLGDLKGNGDRAFAAWEQGKAEGADLVALTEMFITGYNAQDLVMKPAFHQAAMAEVGMMEGSFAALNSLAHSLCFSWRPEKEEPHV